MQGIRLAAILVLTIATIGVGAVSGPFGASVSSPASAPAKAPTAPLVPAATTLASAPPPPTMTFARTVLVETFTAVWCIHCPNETAALYNIDQDTPHSQVVIAELHSCAFAPGSGPCLENYVPPDGTTTVRGDFYGICGFPDVFFDGLGYPKLNGGPGDCGAVDNTSYMQAEYEGEIANASAFPANVSIAQTASIGSGVVNDQATITSGITGSYNVVTYLLQYVNKLGVTNGYGPHDLANVVRETLMDHPVNLTAGATTELNISGALNTSWDALNLSVITFVQQNSTKIVENANMATVQTMLSSVSSEKDSLNGSEKTTITVQLTNSSTGADISGAVVNLTSNGGGTFAAPSGVTSAAGTYTTTYTAPVVGSVEDVTISAQSTEAGYTTGSASTIVVVNPFYPPSIPLHVTISPGADQVTLNWSAPASGGNGLNYYVYDSSTQTGGFSFLGISGSTGYVAKGLGASTQYWFEVTAHDNIGFSSNTTAISATAVTVSAMGLPPNTGWWISFGSSGNFTSASGDPLTVYAGNGLTSYQYGATTYAWEAASGPGSFTVSGTTVSVQLQFIQRLAVLQGTVTPENAVVTLDGSVLSTQDGAFTASLVPGAYYLNATRSGYTTNSTHVTVTAGNITTLTIALQPAKASTTPGGGSSPQSLFSGSMGTALIGIILVAVLVVALGVGIMLSRRGKAGKPKGGPGSEGEGSSP